MLDDLKFVIGAVAKKDFVPELTHIKIKNGWAQGFNGQISSATRIQLDLDFMPWATEMVEAVAACKDTVALSMTAAGKLAVKSGKFKCFVPCLDVTDENLQSFPLPEGQDIPVGSEFIEMLKVLEPFMSTDASRPWAQGIMLDNLCAFATNNVMLAQYWHGMSFPHQVTIPAEAVKEILKRKVDPTSIQMTNNSLTVWFGRERWLRTQLIENGFPAQIYDVIEAPGEPGIALDQYPGLFEALETLKRFTNISGDIFFTGGALSTTREMEDGAHMEVPNIPEGMCFNVDHLLLLKDCAAKLDLSQFPKPCRFWGVNQRLRGIFTGKAQ